MLCRGAFHLSIKVVTLPRDNSSAKAYLYNQYGTLYLFLSELACCILNVADKHDITLISAYITTNLNMEADYHGEGWFQNGFFFFS